MRRSSGENSIGLPLAGTATSRSLVSVMSRLLVSVIIHCLPLSRRATKRPLAEKNRPAPASSSSAPPLSKIRAEGVSLCTTTCASGGTTAKSPVLERPGMIGLLALALQRNELKLAGATAVAPGIRADGEQFAVRAESGRIRDQSFLECDVVCFGFACRRDLSRDVDDREVTLVALQGPAMYRPEGLATGSLDGLDGSFVKGRVRPGPSPTAYTSFPSAYLAVEKHGASVGLRFQRDGLDGFAGRLCRR